MAGDNRHFQQAVSRYIHDGQRSLWGGPQRKLGAEDFPEAVYYLLTEYLMQQHDQAGGERKALQKRFQPHVEALQETLRGIEPHDCPEDVLAALDKVRALVDTLEANLYTIGLEGVALP